ncbi:hypothetical protein GCM10017710_45660 [Arthrobacter ramosus]
MKNPGEIVPGEDRWPRGPPINSVTFLSKESLRLGTTKRARFSRLCGFVSCMNRAYLQARQTAPRLTPALKGGSPRIAAWALTWLTGRGIAVGRGSDLR